MIQHVWSMPQMFLWCKYVNVMEHTVDILTQWTVIHMQTIKSSSKLHWFYYIGANNITSSIQIILQGTFLSQYPRGCCEVILGSASVALLVL